MTGIPLPVSPDVMMFVYWFPFRSKTTARKFSFRYASASGTLFVV
jgi:hypothetical protein